MFKGNIGWNMEVYLDYLLVKSKEPCYHIVILREAFVVLLKYKMKSTTRLNALSV